MKPASSLNDAGFFFAVMALWLMATKYNFLSSMSRILALGSIKSATMGWFV